jgi:hypothetical protein
MLDRPRTSASAKRSGAPSTRTTRSWQMIPPTVGPFHVQNP